jgi:DNA-binding NarL/FixJ family response regulator
MTIELGEPVHVAIPRVLLADGDAATRAGIRIALERAGMKVCAEVANADAVVREAAKHRPDAVLLSIDLAGGGVHAATTIVSQIPNAAVIFLTSRADADELIDCVCAGATGYVVKTISPKRLPAAVTAVLRGEAAIPRSLVGILMNRLRDRGSRRHLAIPRRRGVDLTSREWEVLDLLRGGSSTREIANRLHISEITVRRHIASVLKKLEVPTRREALKLLQSA